MVEPENEDEGEEADKARHGEWRAQNHTNTTQS